MCRAMTKVSDALSHSPIVTPLLENDNPKRPGIPLLDTDGGDRTYSDRGRAPFFL